MGRRRVAAANYRIYHEIEPCRSCPSSKCSSTSCKRSTWTCQIYVTKRVSENSVHQKQGQNLDSKPGAPFAASTQPYAKYGCYY